MGIMEYKVDPNNQNVSTTVDQDKVELQWNIMNVYQSQFTLDSLLKTLEIIDTFKREYPDKDVIRQFETIVREEICRMFGGSLNVE
jgi:hypothetical protein